MSCRFNIGVDLLGRFLFFGATHYGVFADKGAKVDVTFSKIHHQQPVLPPMAGPCSTPTARPDRFGKMIVGADATGLNRSVVGVSD